MAFLNRLPGMEPVEGEFLSNPCKYLLWQDLLMGLFDKNIESFKMGAHYKEMRKRMEGCISTNGEYGFIFEFMEKLCSVLEMKAEMGLRITGAYKIRDYVLLKSLVEGELPELAKRVNSLRAYHRKLWLDVNKPFGWEVLDIRYGGLLMRIDSVIECISDFINGEIDKIEELEQERLYFSGKTGLSACNQYFKIPSASRISVCYAW